LTVMTSALQHVSEERVRDDCRVLRKTLFRLGLPFLIRRVATVVVGVAVYLLLANWILNFGSGVSYAKLGAPDAPVVGFLTRINPYLWWTLVVILGFITFFWLKSAWRNGVARERSVPVPAAEVRELAQVLCVPVLNVLRWVWVDHADPLSIGDLQRALAETRGGRIEKMQIAIEQQSVLGAARPI